MKNYRLSFGVSVLFLGACISPTDRIASDANVARNEAFAIRQSIPVLSANLDTMADAVAASNVVWAPGKDQEYAKALQDSHRYLDQFEASTAKIVGITDHINRYVTKTEDRTPVSLSYIRWLAVLIVPLLATGAVVYFGGGSVFTKIGGSVWGFITKLWK